MTKEEKLIESLVSLVDERMDGVDSMTAGPLFYDIADVCRRLGYTRLERIMRQVAFHYKYD
jgi:hypothetical protein